MTQVGQGTLDLVVSPGHILPRKANNKIDDLLPYSVGVLRTCDAHCSPISWQPAFDANGESYRA